MPLSNSKAFFMFEYMINWLEQHLLTCFFKSHFGFDCPGCGMQRALISLLKGDISDSLRYHAALIPFVITIIFLILQLVLKREHGAKYVMWAFITTSAVTLIQFIVRQVILFS